MDSGVRSFFCAHCNTHHDRDVNAAIIIRNEGLRILSLGTSDTALGGNDQSVMGTSLLLPRLLPMSWETYISRLPKCR
ncbi:MAG: hypothetical protein V7K23_16425 [Nostoc sp.]